MDTKNRMQPLSFIKQKRTRQLLIRILIFIALLLFIFIFVGSFRVVHNNDMYPLISDGQGVIVSYLSSIKTQDAVLYKASDKKYHIGRIVAKEGDKVIIDDNGLKINGIYDSSFLPYRTKSPGGMIKMYVGNDEFYILNDYRERTTDSRIFGPIKKEDIKGKIIFTIKYRNI